MTRRLFHPFVLAMPLAVCGCTTSSAGLIGEDIDFARGCWAAHAGPGGPVTALLRLLPDRKDGSTLTGHLSVMFDNPVISALKSSSEFTLTRDGSSLTIAPAGEPARTMARTGPPRAVLETLGPGHAIAAFSTSADAQVWVILTGGDDSLAIFTVSAGESANDILFDGERDGCD